MFLRWLRSLLLATLVIAFLANAGLSYLVGEVLSLKSLVFVLGLVAAVNYIAAGVLDSAALTGRTRSVEDTAASKGLWTAAGVITLAGLATVYSVFTFWKNPAAPQFETASLPPLPPAIAVKGLASASYSPRNEIPAPAFSTPEPAMTMAPTPTLAAPLPARREEARVPAVKDVIPFSPEQ
jgi:hypothetical protein